MPKAKEGDTIKVNYTGKLTDGTVFDSSENQDPLEFKLGEGKLIPGFEQAVTGMDEGDSTTVTIPSDEAYGTRRDDLELEVAKAELPDDVDPEVGMQLQMKQEGSDKNIPVQITRIDEDKVTLDANHPLAGKDLTFDIEVVDISQ